MASYREGFLKGIAEGRREAVAEIERLRAALQRVDGINDNPAHYNSEIDTVVREALRDEQSQGETK